MVTSKPDAETLHQIFRSYFIESYGRKPDIEIDGRISKLGHFFYIESANRQSTLGSYQNVAGFAPQTPPRLAAGYSAQCSLPVANLRLRWAIPPHPLFLL